MSMIEDAVRKYLIDKGLSVSDATALARDQRVQDAGVAIYQGNTASLPKSLQNFNALSVKDFQQRAGVAGISASSLFLHDAFGDQLPLGKGVAAPLSRGLLEQKTADKGGPAAGIRKQFLEI